MTRDRLVWARPDGRLLTYDKKHLFSYDHSGDSAVIDPRGKLLFEKSRDTCIHTQCLDYTVLSRYRKTFPAWKDADEDPLNR